MSDIRFNTWLHRTGSGGVYQDSSGRVGIGTSVPTSSLDVQSGNIKIGNNTLSSSGVSTFTTVNATTFTGNLTGNINSSGVSTFTNGPVLIGSGTSTGTASQPLQVTGGAYVSGNLGIGITNPQDRLDVGVGTIRLLNSGTPSRYSQLYNNGSGFIFNNSVSGDDFIFLIGGSNERMRLSGTSGNLGIGSANPQTKLDVAGTIRISSGSALQTNSIVPVGGIPVGASGGGIVQVVSVVDTGMYTTTSTSLSTLISASITPTSSSNKILVMCGFGEPDISTGWGLVHLYRGTSSGTKLGEIVTEFGRGITNGSESHYAGASLTYLDSPATTSSTTYSLQFRNIGSGTFRVGNGGDHYITLMEVSG